jgi:hypothetical protein
VAESESQSESTKTQLCRARCGFTSQAIRGRELVRHVRRGPCGGLGPPFAGDQTASTPDRSTIAAHLLPRVRPGLQPVHVIDASRDPNISAIVMARSTPSKGRGLTPITGGICNAPLPIRRRRLYELGVVPYLGIQYRVGIAHPGIGHLFQPSRTIYHPLTLVSGCLQFLICLLIHLAFMLME